MRVKTQVSRTMAFSKSTAAATVALVAVPVAYFVWKRSVYVHLCSCLHRAEFYMDADIHAQPHVVVT